MHEGAKATLRPADRWLVTDLLSKSFRPLFCLYVYLLILLPSGSLFGINVKVVCFALLIVPALYHLVGILSMTARQFSLLIALPVLFAGWIFVAQLYGYEIAFSLNQYKEIIVTLISAWIAAVYFQGSDKAKTRFLQMVLHAEVAACVLKVALLAYCAIRGISVALMVDSINQFTGANLMGMDFESSLGRIQFIADGLIPLCIYMLLCYRARLAVRTLSALVMFVLLITSLAFTFSRYFWAFAALALILGLLLGKKDRFKAALLIALSVIIVVSFPLLVALAQLRFSADVAGGSDNTRTLQIPALERFFFEAPIFGHGFGSHTAEVIRSGELPYVYEVQLLALAGQEGIAGLLLMTIAGLYYFRSLWLSSAAGKHSQVTQKLGLGLLLLFWISAGFLNPTLLNSAAAMSYAAIKAMAEIDDDRGLTGRSLATLDAPHLRLVQSCLLNSICCKVLRLEGIYGFKQSRDDDCPPY